MLIKLLINKPAFPLIYKNLKHNELKMFLHLVYESTQNNKSKCVKEDIMEELSIKQEKTYYNCRKRLIELELIKEDLELIETVEVNKAVIKNVSNA